MPRQITVTTGARLHFGLLSHGLEGSRRFGGAGVMIDSPGFELCVEPAERTTCEAPDWVTKRVEGFVTAYRQNCWSKRPPRGCRIWVRRCVPAHVGLGSGTQLGMAVARALSLLDGGVDADPVELAKCVGRWLRSAVGVHGFGYVGVIGDAGKTDETSIGSVLQRVDFPSSWRFLLVAPHGVSGVSGQAEREAFGRLPPMSQATTDQLRQVLLQELLPSVAEADFDRCGAALQCYGGIVGEYFAPLQGGPYAEESMEQLAEHLRQAGRTGIGQTSWGPTLFVLCRNSDDAAELRDRLLGPGQWDECEFRIAAPLNAGASVAMC